MVILSLQNNPNKNTEVNIMQKTNISVMEVRHIGGHLVAKHYVDKGVIEIKDGEYVVQIIIGPGIPIKILRGRIRNAK